MIREAKSVALHDLSFWSPTLPLLDGFHRIIHHYHVELDTPIAMRLSLGTGRQLHDLVLSSLIEQWDGSSASSKRDERESVLAGRVLSLMSKRRTQGSPSINVPVPGCGVVVGGSCDLLWRPFLVELKLTKTGPNVRDIRQVLTYAALLYLSNLMTSERGLVVNPRLGVAVEFSVSELLLIAGGLDLDEFASRLSQFLVAAAQSN